jgi:hypothetical protein
MKEMQNVWTLLGAAFDFGFFSQSQKAAAG